MNRPPGNHYIKLHMERREAQLPRQADRDTATGAGTRGQQHHQPEPVDPQNWAFEQSEDLAAAVAAAAAEAGAGAAAADAAVDRSAGAALLASDSHSLTAMPPAFQWKSIL